MRKPLAFFLAIASAGLVVLLGVAMSPSAVAGLSSAATTSSYAYDVPIYDTPGNDVASGRVPPAQGLAANRYDAVDLRSHGTSARAGGGTPSATSTYDYPASLAQVARPMTLTGTQVEGTDGALSSFQRSVSAANTGPRVWTNLAPKDPLFPGRTVPLNRLSSVNGRFQYVVGQDGRLIVGRGGHIDLARGSGVTAAGEVRVVNGEVRMFNNASGHYQPDASIQGIAQTAFENAGLNIRNGAWQAVTH